MKARKSCRTSRSFPAMVSVPRSSPKPSRCSRRPGDGLASRCLRHLGDRGRRARSLRRATPARGCSRGRRALTRRCWAPSAVRPGMPSNRPCAPNAGCLQIRQTLKLFANLRPVKVLPALADSSPLKPEIVAGCRSPRRARIDRRHLFRKTLAALDERPRPVRGRYPALSRGRDRAGGAARVPIGREPPRTRWPASTSRTCCSRRGCGGRSWTR